MEDTRDLLERTGERFSFPGDAFERLTRRRERKIRNRRIGAWAVAAAIAGLSVVLVARALPGSADLTGRDPSPSVASSIDLHLDGARHAFVHVSSGEVTGMVPEGIDGGSFYPVSPDGTRFAFHPCCDPPVSGFVANIDGTGARRVTPDDVDAYGPRWSPDGTSIVYQGRDGFSSRIGDVFVVDVQTGRIVQVTELEQIRNGWWFLSPTFSADGRSILFHLPRGPGSVTWDLWSVPLTGGEPVLVRRNAAFGGYSTDGRLVYLSPMQPNFLGSGLWVVDDGGEARQLVDAPGIGWPRWSPDGTRIAYQQGGDVYVLDVESGRSKRVSRGGRPEWFDDDTLVVRKR